MVVALAADVDIRIVVGQECAAGWHEIVVGRTLRVAQLVEMAGFLVRVVAGDANNAHVRVAGGHRQAVDQRVTSGSRVTTTAVADAVGRVHVFGHGRVLAGLPFRESGLIETLMAAAADCRGDFHARTSRRIERIGRMKGRRAMTVFALHAREIWRRLFVDKSRRRVESDAVAHPAGAIGQAAFGGEERIAERRRVLSCGFRMDQRRVASHAALGTAVVCLGPGDGERVILGSSGDDLHSHQVGVPADRPP